MYSEKILKTTVMKNKKIALLTLQHLSNAPRAQKEAGALARAGADVTVFGSWWHSDRAEEDHNLAKKLGIKYVPLVDLRPEAKSTFGLRLRIRLAKEAIKYFGLALPESFGISSRAMVREIKALKPDLTMVHSEPGLWAGKQLIQDGFKVGIDFEDWFSEDLLEEARKTRPVAAIAEAERFILENAAVKFATTDAMGTALAEWAGLDSSLTTIPNTFPWADSPKEEENLDKRDPKAVSFYWFSQTIGPGRGLESLADALTHLKGNWQLHLRGRLSAREGWFENTFSEEIRDRVIIQPIVPNHLLPAHSASHDVGLALEEPFCKSRDLTATNKIFEYLRCGLSVIATETSGQREVMNHCPDAGCLIPSDNPVALISALQNCIDSPEEVAKSKDAAKVAAAGQWSWEKYETILVDQVQQCLADTN